MITAMYAGKTVVVIAYAAKGDRSQIATKRGLRWVKTSHLVTTPETARAAAIANPNEAGPQ